MALMLLRRTKQPRDWDIVKKALQMALLGLFSNVVSTLIYGRVIDYIQMPWFRTNLADWAIIASIIVLAYLIIFPNKKAPTSL